MFIYNQTILSTLQLKHSNFKAKLLNSAFPLIEIFHMQHNHKKTFHNQNQLKVHDAISSTTRSLHHACFEVDEHTKLFHALLRAMYCNLGTVYTGSVPFGTVYKWVLRPCVYTGPTGTVPNGTASRTQTGPLTKSIPFGTVPRKISCKRMEWFQMGTARK